MSAIVVDSSRLIINSQRSSDEVPKSEKYSSAIISASVVHYPIGIKITKALAVSKVERGSAAEQVLQYGDMITHIDDSKVDSRKELEEVLEEKCKNKYKVYVTRIVENTLAAMSLSAGDAILDVDSVPVTAVTETSDAIGEGLQKAGYVTLVIEQANDPQAVAQVRLALQAEKTIQIDLPLAPDVIDICKQQYKRFKRNPDLQPKQSILKSTGYVPRASDSRIKVNEQTEDVPIACEENPALLMKVPAAPPRPCQGQYFSLAETQKGQ